MGPAELAAGRDPLPDATLYRCKALARETAAGWRAGETGPSLRAARARAAAISKGLRALGAAPSLLARARGAFGRAARATL
jgi:hypothetical protein